MTAKLTRSEIARLGGLARSQKYSRAVVQEWGHRGGMANLERNGRYALTKASYMAAGKLPRGPIVARKETAASTAASQSPEGNE